MAQPTTGYGKTSERTAEQRMRQWVLRSEIEQRLPPEEAVAQLGEKVQPYVAISRETGAGARLLAEQLSRRLGWDVLGRELLDEMADKYHLERGMVGAFDESPGSWMMDVFAKWLDHRVVVPTEYVTRLGKIVLMAAHHGRAVFVGRGAQFLLPRERGLAVRIIAPLEARVERIAEAEGIDFPQAKRHVLKQDQARREFVQKYYHRDATDPHLYDMVINLEHISTSEAVDWIVQSCNRRFSSEA